MHEPGPVEVNRIFHDHECAYYDERFAIVHDARSARQARRELERLLGRPLRGGGDIGGDHRGDGGGDHRRDVVLDVGCGTGWFAAGLRRAGVTGLVVGADLSAGMLAKAAAAGAHPLLRCDAARLPVRDGSVDVVACRGVLHHLPDVDAALAEWRRVLRPGGAVVVASEPTPVVERHSGALLRVLLPLLRRDLTPEEDFWEVAAMAANLHVFTAAELAERARRAGFRTARLRTAGLAETLLLTASYVAQGRRPVTRRLPWRRLADAARRADEAVFDRLAPPGGRHTVTGVLHA